MPLSHLISELKNRLPELEWRASKLPGKGLLWRVPQGIFRTKNGQPLQEFIDEIRQDLEVLATRSDNKSQQHLCQQIDKKMHLLIRMTMMKSQSVNEKQATHSIIQKLGNRQQWLQEIEEKIKALQQQVEAIEHQLQQSRFDNDPQAQLNLQQQAGQARQRLNLLEEHYQRASSFNNKDSRP